ncbi:hypothetical protein F5X96DRAFT_684974 [Biscogniauxia mediterranea]|nr:hypothetical protein F5X96DRAFT_684974 [Biscogniauxia mediterranea]
MSARIGKAGLALLKSHVRIRTTATKGESKYLSVDVNHNACRIMIHATKPFPDPLLLLLPSSSSAGAVNPRDYVEVAHSDCGSCRCPAFAHTPETLFPIWRRVADALRYGEGQPEIWPAFAFAREAGDGDNSYAAAEALAAAALVAKMGLRITEWPEGFDGLAEELGAKRKEEEGEEEEEEEGWGEDWQDEDEGLEEGEIVEDGDHQDQDQDPGERVVVESLSYVDTWSAMAAANNEW